MTGLPIKAKDTAPFPIPLDHYFRRWAREETLLTRLRAALALALEVEGAGVVLVGSVLDNMVKGMLNELFIKAKQRREL